MLLARFGGHRRTFEQFDHEFWSIKRERNRESNASGHLCHATLLCMISSTAGIVIGRVMPGQTDSLGVGQNAEALSLWYHGGLRAAFHPRYC